MNFFNEYFEIDEDKVHAKDLQFDEMYDEYNKLYFGRRLPIIPIVMSPTMKKAGGRAHAVRETDDDGIQRYVPTRIQISSFFKSHPDRFKCILLHEMLHVFFFSTMTAREYEKTFGKDAHNHIFMEYADKLTKMSGIKVSARDDVTDSEASTTKKTTLGYMIILIKGKPAIRVFKATLYDDPEDVKVLMRQVDRMRMRGVTEAYIGKSDNSELVKYPIQRSKTTITLYGTTQELYDELKPISENLMEKI